MGVPKGQCRRESVTGRRGALLARKQEWPGGTQGGRGEALGPTPVNTDLEEAWHRERCCLCMGRQGLGRKRELGTPKMV